MTSLNGASFKTMDLAQGYAIWGDVKTSTVLISWTLIQLQTSALVQFSQRGYARNPTREFDSGAEAGMRLHVAALPDAARA